MTRHGKNCTAGMVYTYQERKKDARQSGYGTDQIRTSKDSVKDFDCCCLTLQPCRDPVITPDGYLYDKEAILEYIITKKNEFSRKMKQYEKEKRQEELEMEELAAAEQRSRLRRFEGQESSIISKLGAAAGAAATTATAGAGPSGDASVSNMTADKARKLPSFWIPSLTPAAKKSVIKKPDKTVLCPMSGRPLRVKDFIAVVFTPVCDPHDKTALISKRNRFMCRVTHDILGNTVPAAVLRPTGDVVTMECVEKLIRKDMRHPVTGELLTEADIIPLQMGGTGFAGTNDQLSTSGARPVMQV
ncbi:nitric oxide synthase-interacting protein-like [Pollicipes pollicipes]|uniref:nitric oxide synthase-interacting protein-like n=1 Tax=Pollicipes pollicipes TaxID=41117 RepID=UPI001884E29E|nr:nitric oxide synthase-interacting protein-like [Pollicipes pollicipes]